MKRHIAHLMVLATGWLAAGLVAGEVVVTPPNAQADRPPRFRLDVEALGFTRAFGPERTGLAYVDEPAAAPDLSTANDRCVLDTDDLELDDWAFTAKLTFSYDISDSDAIEASYFGFDTLDWEQESRVNSPVLFAPDIGVLYVPFGTVLQTGNVFDNPTLGYWFSGWVEADYRSSLRHNAELNYVRTMVAKDGDSVLAGSGLLAGVRYLALDEAFTLSARFNSDLGTYSIKTDNDLIGGQLGGKLVLNPHEKIKIALTGKVGLTANMADKTDSLLDPGLTVHTSTDETKFAWIGDVGIRFTGQLHKHVSLTAGYNMLYVDGVGLAPDQIDFTQGRLRRNDIEENDVLYHGFNAGIRITW